MLPIESNSKRSTSLCYAQQTNVGGLARVLAAALFLVLTNNALYGQQGAQAGAVPNGQPNADGQVRVPLVNPQQAVQQGLAEVPKQPFPPLAAGEQQFLDQVLNVWEKRTAQVQRYQCDFGRWQYDPAKFFDANNPQGSYYSQAKGKIKYMHPDKGVFKVDELKTIANKNPPAWKVNPRQPHGEYWICDGQWVFIRDRNNKKELQVELPPNMRGAGIPDSPLPFLFGVKAARLKARYWIRPVQAPPGDESVWLEAWPKRADDAGNYSRVQVVLDRKDILPRALIVFMPNWRPNQEHKEIYQFSNRITPQNNLWNQIQGAFGKDFIREKLPSDWTIDKQPFIPAAQQQAMMQQMQQQQAAQPQGRVAQPPAGGNMQRAIR